MFPDFVKDKQYCALLLKNMRDKAGDMSLFVKWLAKAQAEISAKASWGFGIQGPH
jgi:hypothetical protein